MKHLFTALALAVLFGVCAPAAARAGENPEIPNPEAPIIAITLMEIAPHDLDRAVEDWIEVSKIAGQRPGHITTTLYRALLASARYQLVTVAQWQSHEAWRNAAEAAGDGADTRRHSGLYRPAAWSTNSYAGLFPGDGERPAVSRGAPLQRAQRDPAIRSPESPFVFINLMEMDAGDVGPFVAGWRIRSKIMGQMPAAIGSTLYRTVLPDSAFPIVNVSQWQSYSGFIDANNDPFYAQELSSDLGNTPSVKLTRGFYRPVATSTHIYGDDVP